MNILRTIKRGMSKFPFFGKQRLRLVRPIQFIGFLRMPMVSAWLLVHNNKVSVNVKNSVVEGVDTYWRIRGIQSEIKQQLLDNAKEKE